MYSAYSSVLQSRMYPVWWGYIFQRKACPTNLKWKTTFQAASVNLLRTSLILFRLCAQSHLGEKVVKEFQTNWGDTCLWRTLYCLILMGSIWKQPQDTSFKMPDGKTYSLLKVHMYNYNGMMILIFSSVLIFCLINQFMFIMHLSVN